VVAGLAKKRRVMSRHEQEVIAYHEAGHALVAEALPQADRVHRISIIPRGIAALGYTLQLPTEDRYLLTRGELLDRLTVLLGGRSAEELALQEISTGAQDDLERATELARSMVLQYGMSDTLGPLTYERGRRPLYLEPGLPLPRAEVSEETAREIDAEVRALVMDAHARAQKILASQREILETLARTLLEKETVEGKELRTIIAATRQAACTSERRIAHGQKSFLDAYVGRDGSVQRTEIVRLEGPASLREQLTTIVSQLGKLPPLPADANADVLVVSTVVAFGYPSPDLLDPFGPATRRSR
jgi:cell division protease FtsH